MIFREGPKQGKYGIFRCQRVGHPPFSVSRAKNSILADTHLGAHMVFLLIWLFCEDSSHEQYERHTKMPLEDHKRSSRTVCDWISLFREVCEELAYTHRSTTGKLGGPGKIVQIDETCCGGRKYNKGRRVNHRWVWGCIEARRENLDKNSDIRMIFVDKRDADHLTSCIEDHIAPGTEIWSDCWKGYNTRRLQQLGYTHKTVNHSNEEGSKFIAEDGTHTNRIESSWRPFKQWIRNWHHATTEEGDERFSFLLSEFYWRRECRLRGVDKFNDILRGIKRCFPADPLYKDNE